MRHPKVGEFVHFYCGERYLPPYVYDSGPYAGLVTKTEGDALWLTVFMPTGVEFPAVNVTPQAPEDRDHPHSYAMWWEPIPQD